MSESELYFVLKVGIPIFLVFAICALGILTFQAHQFAKHQGTTTFAKSATIGGLSFALSMAATFGIAFFAGIYIASGLIVLWFLTAASLGGLPDLGIVAPLIISAIPVVIALFVMGIILGMWPISALSIRGYKIAKQKQSIGAKLATASVALAGAIFCVASILTAFFIVSSVAIQLSGKRLGLA